MTTKSYSHSYLNQPLVTKEVALTNLVERLEQLHISSEYRAEIARQIRLLQDEVDNHPTE